MASSSFVRVVGIVVAVLATTGVARAEDLCPIGSSEKKEDGFTWCEPSICETDSTCPTGSLCRPVPLCVEVGQLDAGKGDGGGARLMARQRCGEGSSCPQNTTCSAKGRCLTRAQADKAALMSATTTGSVSAPLTAPSASPGEAPKKACGCDVPGTRRGGELAGGVLAMLGLVVIGARRRARRS